MVSRKKDRKVGHSAEERTKAEENNKRKSTQTEEAEPTRGRVVKAGAQGDRLLLAISTGSTTAPTLRSTNVSLDQPELESAFLAAAAAYNKAKENCKTELANSMTASVVVCICLLF
jgi:hypothetical protein